MKILVTGWFSFEDMGASAGDLLARDLACDWLREAGCNYDIASAAPFTDGIPWETTNPSEYSYVLFVCGPFGNGPPLVEFLDHFSGSPLIGLNLTMLQALEEWDPFEFLLERDSSRTMRPDIALGAAREKVPVVGIVLIDHQPEYGDKDLHTQVDKLIQEFLDLHHVASVKIDTRLDHNTVGLRSPAEIESLITKMDMIITTRLHGLVLSIKNQVPVVAIDSVEGGAKLTRQANVLEWPNIHSAETLTLEQLEAAYQYCLTEEAASKVRSCRERAIETIKTIGQELRDYLEESPKRS